MMVKVVGKDNMYVLKTTCRKCASILEYTESECRVFTSRDYSGSSDEYKEIACPTYNNKIYV
jgi:hypothetical protein